MKIQAEQNYDAFAARIAVMRAGVTSAIDRDALVDDQCNPVSRWSFRWVVLSVLRPFYALFGRDAFSHFRVDGVALKVFAYCELNKKFMSDELQQLVAVGILEKLQHKTGNKYTNTISMVASQLKEIRQETKKYWSSQKALLENMAAASWNDGPPNALSDIVKRVQEAADASGVTDIVRATTETLSAKCWKVAFKKPDLKEKIAACQECFRALAGKESVQVAAKYSQVTSFVFDDNKELKVPAYWKKILMAQSTYFQAMWQRETSFKETLSSTIHFPGKNRRDFLEIVDALKTGTLLLGEYSIEESIAFIALLDELQIEQLLPQAVQRLAEDIEWIPPSAKNLERVKACDEKIEGSDRLKQAVSSYYQKHLHSLRSFAKKVAFLEEHGSKILSLTLPPYSCEQLDTQIKLCPNLTSLNLDDCSRHGVFNVDNSHLKQIAACSKLEALSMRDWGISSSGLHYLKELKNLRCLDLSGCLHIWRKDFEIFDQQVKDGLKINCTRCADDVEVERRVQEQIFRASTVAPFCLTCGKPGMCFKHVPRGFN